MIKPIGTQYQAAKKNRRVGLTHVSKVIERLMRIYGLEDDLIDQQETEAAAMQTEAFEEAIPVLAPMPTNMPAMASSQSTFGWFE